MQSALRQLVVWLGLLATGPAVATTPVPVPEPGIIELLAAGVVAGVIVWARKRRK